MKPYYQDETTTLYCADNRAAPWPDCVDLILTDPPYSNKTHDGAMTNGTAPTDMHMGFDAWSAMDLQFYFARFGDIATRWIISFLDWRHTALLERDPPETLRFVRHGVWVKPNGAPQFTGDRPAQGWESIAMLHRANVRLRWNGGGKSSVYTCNVAHHHHRISEHPNAKPMRLMADLIRDFSEPNDLVFDPFVGSGASVAAAALLGRRAWAIEQNEQYCADLVYWLTHHRPRNRKTTPVDDQQLAMEEL